jgi:hypothetical protein
MSKLEKPSFLNEKLEYLPPKKQVISKELIESRKLAFIEPPSSPLVSIGSVHAARTTPPYMSDDELSELERHPNNFYDEINNNKARTMDKVKKMFKYNPFVPIGCLVTVGVLINGVRAMKQKDRVKSQRMMRYRIAAQGATLIALVVGTLLANHFASLKDKNDQN